MIEADLLPGFVVAKEQKGILSRHFFFFFFTALDREKSRKLFLNYEKPHTAGALHFSLLHLEVVKWQLIRIIFRHFKANNNFPSRFFM